MQLSSLHFYCDALALHCYCGCDGCSGDRLSASEKLFISPFLSLATVSFRTPFLHVLTPACVQFTLGVYSCHYSLGAHRRIRSSLT